MTKNRKANREINGRTFEIEVNNDGEFEIFERGELIAIAVTEDLIEDAIQVADEMR